MKKALTFIMVILLFNSCKKEETNWEYWINKSSETYNKIVKLSDKYTCSDIPNISIKTIKIWCETRVLIHNNDISMFEKLYNEYQYYIKKSLDYDPSYVLDCINSYPIKIDCKEGKPKLVYVHELNLEELQIEMSKLYDEIKKYYENTNCNNPNEWLGITLLTGESVEAIAIKKGDSDFNYKVNTYNQMNLMKLRIEGKKIENNFAIKINVKCENNKALAEFE